MCCAGPDMELMEGAREGHRADLHKELQIGFEFKDDGQVIVPVFLRVH